MIHQFKAEDRVLARPRGSGVYKNATIVECYGYVPIKRFITIPAPKGTPPEDITFSGAWKHGKRCLMTYELESPTYKVMFDHGTEEILDESLITTKVELERYLESLG